MRKALSVWILALLTWPISLLAGLSAWQRLESAQLESDPALEGSALIRWLLWPMARGDVGHVGRGLSTSVIELFSGKVHARQRRDVSGDVIRCRIAERAGLECEIETDHLVHVKIHLRP